MQVILASSSKRRIDILKKLGFDVQVKEHCYNEDMLKGENAKQYVIRVSKGKAESIKDNKNLIIGCDTIVELNDNIIQKPQNRIEAKEMLLKMSNKMHRVISGLTLIKEERIISEIEITKVYFKKLSEIEIEHYLDNAHYIDKAGAYAIQEHAVFFVKRIEGDYWNIVGFPIVLFIEKLKQITDKEYYEYIYSKNNL